MSRAAHRPAVLVVVVGTGTDVGKTWVTARLAADLRAGGTAVAARKVAQSFAEDGTPTDAEVLAAASGESPSVVCPPELSYPLPLAPPMAAEELGMEPLPMDALVSRVSSSWQDGVPVGIVESAGGVRSPLAIDGDSISLIASLRPDLVVLVADSGLGTINAIRCSLDAIHGAVSPERVVVTLNHFDAANRLHQANKNWLEERDRYHVVAEPRSLARLVIAAARSTQVL